MADIVSNSRPGSRPGSGARSQVDDKPELKLSGCTSLDDAIETLRRRTSKADPELRPRTPTDGGGTALMRSGSAIITPLRTPSKFSMERSKDKPMVRRNSSAAAMEAMKSTELAFEMPRRQSFARQPSKRLSSKGEKGGLDAIRSHGKNMTAEAKKRMETMHAEDLKRTGSPSEGASRPESRGVKGTMDDDPISDDGSPERTNEKVKKRPSKPPTATANGPRRPENVGELAQQLNMSLDMTQKAVKMFGVHVGCSPAEQMKARMDKDQFAQVVRALCHEDSADAIDDSFLDAAFRQCDRDQGGDIDVEEFCIWYSANSFALELVLSKDTQETRALAREHDISVADIDRYRTAYDHFDADGSGAIDSDEFAAMITKLLKIPKGQELPASRLKDLWRKADADGSGELDFEEFVIFYSKYFDDRDDSEADPLHDFYQSARRLSKVEPRKPSKNKVM